jgi:RNA polymerase sigma factor (TIGR02999 family)
MTPLPTDDVTALLEGVRAGDQEARERLIALVYPELRNIAARYLRSERPDHTLQPTALAHEAYARLFGARSVEWKSRAYFFATVAREMRRILVEYARGRNADKRAGKRVLVSLSNAAKIGVAPNEDLVALDEALCRFEQLEPRSSRVVELRFFTGLDDTEISEALGISVSTVKRDWHFARLWLFRELRRASS